MSEIAEKFRETPSYDTLLLHVIFQERVVSVKITAQAVFGSLIGLIMPLCGFTKMKFLITTLARIHLPLTSEREALYRVVSLHVMPDCV